jgi:hypothetical protein
MSVCGHSILATNGSESKRACRRCCGSWWHDPCSKVRKRKVIAQVLSGRPTKFLTLTTQNTGTGNPVDEAERMSRALTIFAKRIARKLKIKKIEYAAFFEATEKGWPHFHIVGRWGFIKWKWLRDEWNSIVGRGSVWIEGPDTPGGVSKYVSSYVGKGAHRFGTLKRYRFTRGYKLPEKHNWKPVLDRDEVWQLSAQRLADWCDALENRGWRFAIRSPHFAFARAPP